MLKKSFKIDLSIYDKNLILSAMNDFVQNGFVISFFEEELLIEGESETEIEEIFQEFMNYVLSI